ncbi:MAG TPA: hypothetical protein VLU99_04620, partial [Nitrososphaerales archaeon]|nr:hypothetical protein [Nitrososphaerales archaeon]
ALFSGAYIWLVSAFETGTRLLPPPQRLELIRAVGKRFVVLSWIFIILMSAGGMASAFVVGPQSLGSVTSISGIMSLLGTSQGVILALEIVVTILIVVCNLAIQFVYLPRVTGTSIAVMESSDKSLKWLTAKDGTPGLKAVSRISWLSVTNIVLGVVAIAIGVLYSSL